MEIAGIIVQAIGSLAALMGCIAVVFAIRQLSFNSWLKAQEIFTEKDFVEARRKVYSRLPGRNSELPDEWGPEDHLVCRKMDELVRLAPYFGLFGAGKRIILKTWDDPLAKYWQALKNLVDEEQKRWPQKWNAFQKFGEEAVLKLNLND